MTPELFARCNETLSRFANRHPAVASALVSLEEGKAADMLRRGLEAVVSEGKPESDADNLAQVLTRELDLVPEDIEGVNLLSAEESDLFDQVSAAALR